MASDGEGEIFAMGVDSSVHDRSKKFCLTKYHTKLTRYQKIVHLDARKAQGYSRHNVRGKGEVPMKKSLSKKSYQYIVEQVEQRILSGELKFGDKLPPEREMGEIYNISRNSVREALRVLEVIGLVESRHGEGNFITNKIDACVINALSAMFVLNKGKITELLQMRRAVELGSIRNIIERGRREDVESLRKIIDKYQEGFEVKTYLTIDEQFHRAIVELSDNTLYKIMFNMLSALIIPDMRKVVGMSLESDSGALLSTEHRALLKAIEQGDLKLADTILTQHLLLDKASFADMDITLQVDLSFLQDQPSP